jgi:hypothetical protein
MNCTNTENRVDAEVFQLLLRLQQEHVNRLGDYLPDL